MAKLRYCPQCEDPLTAGADRCSCGWTDPTASRAARKPGSNTLCAVNGCRNLGTAKPGLRGEGLWYCRHHVDPEDRHKQVPAIPVPGTHWCDELVNGMLRAAGRIA